MSQVLLTVLAFATGAFVTTYLTVNTLVAERVGGELKANLPYFLLGFVTTVLIWLARGGSVGALRDFREVPWWAFLAGVGAGVALYATTLLIGRIGPDKFFVASVAGQLVISVAIAHFGWLGTEQDGVTWQKGIGVALAVAGALLVSVKLGEG